MVVDGDDSSGHVKRNHGSDDDSGSGPSKKKRKK